MKHLCLNSTVLGSEEEAHLLVSRPVDTNCLLSTILVLKEHVLQQLQMLQRCSAAFPPRLLLFMYSRSTSVSQFHPFSLHCFWSKCTEPLHQKVQSEGILCHFPFRCPVVCLFLSINWIVTVFNPPPYRLVVLCLIYGPDVLYYSFIHSFQFSLDERMEKFKERTATWQITCCTIPFAKRF